LTKIEQEEFYRFCLFKTEEVLNNDAIDVEFNGKGGSYYFYKENLVVISTKQSLETQAYCLLHEAGHHFLRKSDSPKWVKKSLQDCTRKFDRVNVVREEVLAWEKAESIAKELNLWESFDKIRWDKYVKEQLYDYMKWGVRTRRGSKWRNKK